MPTIQRNSNDILGKRSRSVTPEAELPPAVHKAQRNGAAGTVAVCPGQDLRVELPNVYGCDAWTVMSDAGLGQPSRPSTPPPSPPRSASPRARREQLGSDKGLDDFRPLVCGARGVSRFSWPATRLSAPACTLVFHAEPWNSRIWSEHIYALKVCAQALAPAEASTRQRVGDAPAHTHN